MKQDTINLLLASRRSPDWVTPKQIMYGEALELGRAELSFTPEEAALVAGDSLLSPLAERAAEWPAVASLVSLLVTDSDHSRYLPQPPVPDAVAAYIAAELYRLVEPTVRTSLWKLAVSGVVNAKFAEGLLGLSIADLDGVAEWFVVNDGERLELHPLLRAFLCSIPPPLAEDDVAECVSEITHHLLEIREWDVAFALIERFGQVEAADALLRAATSALDVGRFSSVKRWIAYGASSGCASGLLNFCSANIAFREGRCYEAEALSVASAGNLGEEDPLLFRVWMLAGISAHTGSRELDALRHYRQARRFARSSDEERSAALGEIATAIDLELPEALTLLDTLDTDLPSDRPDLRVSLISRRIAGRARFGLPPDLEQARLGYQLLPQVDDPLARSSYRNIFAYSLIAAGQVQEALHCIAEQKAECEGYRLVFVESHTRILEALAALIAGRFADVRTALAGLELSARSRMDGFLRANVIAITTRLLVSEGRFREAVEASFEDPGAITPSMRAEVKASRAIALACAGRTAEAIREADAAREVSLSSDARGMAAAARAVVAVRTAQADALLVSQDALAAAVGLSSLDGFICATRGYPELAAMLLQDDPSASDLRVVLHASGDLDAIQSRLPAASPGAGTWESLSAREQEVLSLVAAGLSNRQIGGTLFIAEVTVKVHVHHILEKLGVSKRTAAARYVPPHAAVRQPPRPPTRID